MTKVSLGTIVGLIVGLSLIVVTGEHSVAHADDDMLHPALSLEFGAGGGLAKVGAGKAGGLAVHGGVVAHVSNRFAMMGEASRQLTFGGPEGSVDGRLSRIGGALRYVAVSGMPDSSARVSYAIELSTGRQWICTDSLGSIRRNDWSMSLVLLVNGRSPLNAKRLWGAHARFRLGLAEGEDTQPDDVFFAFELGVSWGI